MTDPQTAASSVAEPAPIVLKKYGNRRLYDTDSSRYVTLVEVEAMVQRGADIVVLDAKTGADITKEILVQLLLERDEARAALPVGLLKQAVRLAGTPLRDNLARVMQDGLDAFLGSQRAVLDAQRAFTAQMAQLPMPSLSSLSSMPSMPWSPGAVPSMWNPFAALAPAPPRPADVATANSAPPPASPSPPPPTAPTSSQLDALKAELSETQALVKALLERELAAPPPPRKKKATTKTTKTTRATKATKKPRAR